MLSSTPISPEVTTLQVQGRELHVIVAHLGLLLGGRLRQTQQLHDFIARVVPADAQLLVEFAWDAP
ncbi:hypothetical protein [Limnohabitans sp.]|uniref:hypothetical protein n=1 Tax=Limnohabitans sp. TaxID=1907725 RepID=UPI00286EEDBF|nr:hypothetical protein [Limnohabitans sp.]